MDKETLVDDRIAEARRLIDDLSRLGRIVVSAAYWMESLDDDDVRCYLHVISPTIDEIGWTQTYIALLETVRSRRSIHVGPDDVFLGRPDSPPVAEILDFLRRYPVSEAFRLKGVYLRGHFVNRACIYPIVLDDQSVPLRPVEQSVT